jgi:acylphosphatase
MSDQPRIARMIHYSGRVQGVGFRYTAASIARHYDVAGWVRNLRDGRVQLLIEGDEAEVNAVLRAIRDYFGDNIFNEQSEDRPPEGLAGFDIKL